MAAPLTPPDALSPRGHAAEEDASLANDRHLLLSIYDRLEEAYDLDLWHWRGDTPPLAVCLGAILVQHTAWVNVERAFDSLRWADACSLEAISSLAESDLAALVRPAGMPLTKARRLKAFAALAAERGGLERLLALPPADLIAALRSTPGIGPETANVIALYAAGVVVFPHDAYTERLIRRLGLGPAGRSYAVWQAWHETRLPRDLRVYRRYKAAIVLHCKETCRVRPRCPSCVLLDLCPHGRAVLAER